MLGAPALAGNFRVNPVQINLPSDRQATSLMMTNSDVAEVSVRVLAYSWTQVDGQDVYSPTSDVIVSPPIFTVPAGKTQLVRIGLRNRSGAKAYRVIFEEIPREKPIEGQVQITLRLNLPLYLLPKGGGTADVGWRAWRDRAGDMVVEGSNRGNLQAQFVELSVEKDGGQEILSKQMGVILPGSARQWKAGKRPEFASGSPLMLKVRSPRGETQTQIMLEQR